MLGSRDFGSCEDGDLSILDESFSEPDSNFTSLPSPRMRYLAAPDFVARDISSPCQPPSQCSSVENVASKPPDDPKGVFQSTTFLHAYERPSDLPRKDPQEARRHRIECNKIMQHISKKHQEKLSQIVAQQEKRHANESRIGNRINYWRNEVIPRWETLEQTSQLLDDWWLGIPSSVRSQVWKMIIGNPLGITRDLFERCLTQSRYTIRRLESARQLAEALDLTSQGDGKFSARLDASTCMRRSERFHSLPGSVSETDIKPLSRICLPRQFSSVASETEASIISQRISITPPNPLTPSPSPTTLGDLSSNEEASLQVIRLDVSRTFPMLGVFQSDGLHNRDLHDLLAAFVAYQPTLGYLQGMSFIAGILLLVMEDIYPAFIAFATLMNRPSFYAFYSLDESEFATYFGAFDALLEDRMPRLFAHLKSCRLDCKLYLFDWLFTIFSRSLPLDVDLRIWDLFLRDGEAALLLSALGILRMYEEYLLLWDFDRLASFLTGPMPESMSPDDLTSCMRSLDLSTADIKGALEKARNFVTNNSATDSTVLRGDRDSETPLEARQERPEGQWTRRGLLRIRSRLMKPQGNGNTNNHDIASATTTSKFSAFRRRTFVPVATPAFSAWNREVCLDYPKRELQLGSRGCSAEMFGCRLLLFITCLNLVTAPASSQGSVELTCFDPECSTPYLTGEVITDLPEQSLSKGTVIEIYGQSASDGSYLIKVGEHSHQVHGSFLRIIENHHELRSMVRVKLSRLDSSTVQPATSGEKSVEFSTVPTDGDLSSIAKDVRLSTQKNVPPSPSEEETSDYFFLEQLEQKPDPSTSQSSELLKETMRPSHSVNQAKGIPLSKLQLSEDATMHISEHHSTVQESKSSSLPSSESKVPVAHSVAETTSPVGQYELPQPHPFPEDETSDDRFLQRHQQRQEYQQKPASITSQSSDLPVKMIDPSRPVQPQGKAFLSQKGANMHTPVNPPSLEKPRVVEETRSSPLSFSQSKVLGSGLEDEAISSISQHQLHLSSEKATFDDKFLQQKQQRQQQQEHLTKPGSTDSEASKLGEEALESLHSVKQQKGVPSPTLQTTENANMGPLEHSSALGKSRNVDELEIRTARLSAGQQSLQDSEYMPQAGEAVRMQASNFQSHGSTPEVNTAPMHVEKSQVQQSSVGQIRPQSSQSNEEMSISSESTISTEETTPNTEQYQQQLNLSVSQEPVLQVKGAKNSHEPQFVPHQSIELGHSSKQSAKTLGPRLTTVADQKSYHVLSQSPVPSKEEEKVNRGKTVKQTESELKNVAKVASPESVTKASLPGKNDQGRVNESDEPDGPLYTSVESHFPGVGEKDIGSDDDSPLRPPIDIATESTFFYCLSYASDGSFMSPSMESSSHTVRKSILASIVLFFARKYFNAAQNFLFIFPPALVSSLDRFLTFAFHLPLVFIITWLLFISSILATWLMVKLFNRLLPAGLHPSSSDDPTRRSLAEWLAVEENANLLAGNLADKDEAYARLIVWSAKVSERYEHQARNYSTLEARTHNQLRDIKASLAESLQENKELRVTHDALVEQLSSVKAEAAVTATRLREEVSTLNGRLEECTREYADSIEKEKELLVCEISGHQSRAEKAEKAVNELREANQRFEEDLAVRERELSSLRKAFIEMKSAELKNKKKEQARVPKKSAVVVPKKQNEDKSSTDGWEVEDEFELDEIIEEIESTPEQMGEVDGDEVQSSLREFLEVGRLRVALEESEKQARAESAAHKQETELRTRLQETVEALKCENAELLQRLRIATEDCDASKKKLEILSEYFKEREAVLQRDLGRQALSESESMEELKFLRSKQESYEVEVKTLRDQLASARRELAESERVNRRHISEMDKRLHESWLSARALENVVKDLRGENSMLRQKMFTGERGAVHKLLSGIPPPPPPPPPAVALASAKLPEMRSTSRQSERSVGSHPQIYPSPPPFLPFPQIPLTGPGGSQFIPQSRRLHPHPHPR
ncbi:TBC1 domain family member 12 [Taenia crassiceps]|uniref:TBC1 domain family member 12 n=1 Tax=Taenia crassiceps TaxID=6207 RepID=A0ABR4QJG5_9CEST